MVCNLGVWDFEFRVMCMGNGDRNFWFEIFDFEISGLGFCIGTRSLVFAV